MKPASLPNRRRRREGGGGQHLRRPLGGHPCTGAKESGAASFESKRGGVDVVVPWPDDGLGPARGDLDPTRPGSPYPEAFHATSW